MPLNISLFVNILNGLNSSFYYACYCYFPILFILIFTFYAMIILFPLFLGFCLPPPRNPNLFSKLPPQCFRFEFQSNAAVSSEAAASFLYIEARRQFYI